MGKFNCFFAVFGQKKKKNDKGDEKSLNTVDEYKGLKNLQVRIELPDESSTTDELKSTSFSVPVPFNIPGNPRCNVKVMSHESPVNDEATEIAYEGEDEHDENLSMKRDYSDLDLQARVTDSNEENDPSKAEKTNFYDSLDAKVNDQLESISDMIQGGHVSDPGIGKAEFWSSPKLKRSCSNLETRSVLKTLADQLPLSKSGSFEELHRLAERFGEYVLPGNHGSPRSETTHRSADKVMLKKHSSSQILPSGSRRLWWKLFLWSHRNIHTPLSTVKLQILAMKPGLNQQGGYSSDTLEPNRPLSITGGESLNIGNDDNQSWDGFQVGVSGLWPQNQWVAFPTESPLTRVDEWVKELAVQPLDQENDEDNSEGGIVFPPSPETGRSIVTRHPNMNLPEEIVHANIVIRSLNSSSTVAHISGMGLKVIPTISHFSSLRSVNLSGNLIAHVAPGSLPKGLHTLDLSRNKITSIEGFRELTRLRVLDLSYNRISRIGQGLSNCTLIKELYLAGNKISDIEGLHRLLKLTVLDLSFNKITTVKALGQLVANYNSLLALNLLGNPIQTNINDEQLRKGIYGLLPKLAYLNKQPINPQKAREVATESIAKAALGSSGWNSRRRTAKRVSQSGSASSSGHRSGAASIGQRSRHRLKSRTQHHQSPLKTKSSGVTSSSHY